MFWLCEERLTFLEDFFLLILLILIHELLEHIVCLSMLEFSLSRLILELSKERKHAYPCWYIGSLQSFAEGISSEEHIEESAIV